LVVILTFLTTSAMLPPMTSLRQTSSGMFSVRENRGRLGDDEK
jgi:hypothetical protein